MGIPLVAARVSYILALESVVGIARDGSSSAIDAWNFLVNVRIQR